jgi:hypothetical protein
MTLEWPSILPPMKQLKQQKTVTETESVTPEVEQLL